MPAACDPAGFAEAYVDGRLDIEGDVQAAAELASYLRKIRPPQILRWLDSHTHEKARVAHTLAADSRDVRAHYDLSDEFFRLFLDSQMVYSCAYFAHPEQDLDKAQERKLDLVCRKLRLRPGESFLDVGCGWGCAPDLGRQALRSSNVRDHALAQSGPGGSHHGRDRGALGARNGRRRSLPSASSRSLRQDCLT
jgi:cyclopropane-fatty-acyl-phospholipid synthase